jgi:hypothetical protein
MAFPVVYPVNPVILSAFLLGTLAAQINSPSLSSPDSIGMVQFFSFAAGRVGHSRGKSRASKKYPKSRLTKISIYGLISYVSQRNSYQGRGADQAGAGAGACGTGNSPKAACGRSFASYLSLMSHPRPLANPALPAKNSLLGAVPMKAAKGKSRQIKVKKIKKIAMIGTRSAPETAWQEASAVLSVMGVRKISQTGRPGWRKGRAHDTSNITL